jgi:S-adenosylmethionine synthetase
MKTLFTSEAVLPGHPDKVCDQISDAVLDACLAQDPDSRVACETMALSNLIVLGGEITTKAKLDYREIALRKVAEIGYNNPNKFGPNTPVVVAIQQQSPDIQMGTKVRPDLEQGAGDQGMMFGYARNGPGYMPEPIFFSQRLAKWIVDEPNGLFAKYPGLGPDGKVQVSVRYEDGKVSHVETVVVSIQHSLDYVDSNGNFAKTYEFEEAVRTWFGKLSTSETRVFINPTGRFVIGGPEGDSGLTGRKIVADTYGGWIPHGGGAFSGKDPSKVDRSGAYMMRRVAKNLVASGICSEIQLQIAYAIGVAKPVSIEVNKVDGLVCSVGSLKNLIERVWDFRPAAITGLLDLKRPIYQSTARLGHFGFDGVPWEALDDLKRIHEVRLELKI